MRLLAMSSDQFQLGFNVGDLHKIAAAGQKGLISFKAGNITVLSRSGVEDAACECYLAVRGEYERLLPQHVAA